MKLPQLSLRDLFSIVLLAGLAMAWWLERQEKTQWHWRAEVLKRRVEGPKTEVHWKSGYLSIRNGDFKQIYAYPYLTIDTDETMP
jgi:hypothetical protein